MNDLQNEATSKEPWLINLADRSKMNCYNTSGEVFLPGDLLQNLKVSEKTSKVIIGPGLRQESENVFVSKPGILRHKEQNVYWIDSHQKRVNL